MNREAIATVRDGAPPSCGELSLIRYSHIFSAAVREYLEVKLLQEAGDDHLTPRQLHLLQFIELAGHHIDHVAKFLEITGPAATRAVDKLERRGLVFRAPSGDDRRLKVLFCSEKGKELVARYRSVEATRLDSVLAEFSGDEIADLTRLLERYSLALIATESSERVPCSRCAGYFDANCPLQFIHSSCSYQQHREEKE